MPTNTTWTAQKPGNDPVLILPFVREFLRLCDDGFRMRFHERNGGNLSYWLRQEDVQMLPEKEPDGPWMPMEAVVPTLGGAFFLITASGSCFRNLSYAPAENACIIRLNEGGSCWQLVWGLRKGGRPSSELESHLQNFAIRAQQPEHESRVMYHAHPESVIALSNLLPQDSKTITRALWSSMIECAFIFPYGVGVIPCMIPGGGKISGQTAAQMQTHDAVLWAHHGLFCAGKDFDSAFGLMETIDKAAEIYLKLLASGQKRRYTIPDSIFEEIAQALGGKMNMAYVFGGSDDPAEE